MSDVGLRPFPYHLVTNTYRRSIFKIDLHSRSVIDTMNEKFRVLIAHNNPVVRDGPVAILSTHSDFVVVGQAEDGRTTLVQAQTLHPDALLFDLEMPEMDGVETLVETLRQI